MHVVYINLDRAADRRRALEENFHAVAPPGVRLTRFPAVDASAASAFPGARSPAEKGCFLSHREILRRSLNVPGPLLVLEDDALLSPQAFAVIRRVLELPDWEILFTEVGTGDRAVLLDLFRARERLARTGDYIVLGLEKIEFFSSTAYLVPERGKAKLARLLSCPSIDLPLDLHLRSLIHTKQVHGGVCVPFVTSVNDLVGTSQIQVRDQSLAERTLLALRKLLYIDRDLAELEREVREISREVGPAAQVFGAILGGLASEFWPAEGIR